MMTESMFGHPEDPPFHEIETELAAPVTDQPIRADRAVVCKVIRNPAMRKPSSLLEVPELHVTAETSVKGSKQDAELFLSDLMDNIQSWFYVVFELPEGDPPGIDGLEVEPPTDEEHEELEEPVITFNVGLLGSLPKGGGPLLAAAVTIQPHTRPHLRKGKSDFWVVKNTKEVWATVHATDGKVRMAVGRMRNKRWVRPPRPKVTMDSEGGLKSDAVHVKHPTKTTFTAKVKGLDASGNEYGLSYGWKLIT